MTARSNWPVPAVEIVILHDDVCRRFICKKGCIIKDERRIGPILEN